MAHVMHFAIRIHKTFLSTILSFTFILRAATALGQLSLIWLVAHFSNADTVGLMVLNLAVVTVTCVLVTLGHNIATMRQFALSPYSKLSYQLLIRSTILVILTGSLTYISLYLYGAPALHILGLDENDQYVTQIYLVAVFPGSIISLLTGYFKGIGRTNAAILCDIGLISFVAVVLLLIWIIIYDKYAISDRVIAYTIAGSYGLVLLIATANFIHSLSSAKGDACLRNAQKPNWNLHMRTASKFHIVNLAEIANSTIPLLIIGALVSEASLAEFRVAERLATLLSFGLVVANVTLPPAIGKALANENRGHLQRVLTKGSEQACAVAFVLAIPLALFPSVVLAQMGMEGQAAKSALYLLLFSQIFNVATGSTILTIKLSEHTRFIALLSSITAALYLLFLPIAVYAFGIVGAALAASTTLILYNLAGAIYLKLKFDVLALPFVRHV